MMLPSLVKYSCQCPVDTLKSHLVAYKFLEEYDMSPFSELPCWVIMKCGDDHKCPAKESPHRDCWDIFSEVDKKAFNICQDCIVYLSRQEVSVLSRQEMEMIMQNKGINVNDVAA